MNPGQAAFQLSFQLSPIILVGGLAQAIPGQMLPIISITEAINFTTGLLSGADINLNNFFGNFEPIAGGTLIANEFGKYPFANQSVAANAVITQPLTFSLRMICPVRSAGGYWAKLATITALKVALDKHTQLGGSYTVATPSYIYTNCLLRNLQDVSSSESIQAQNAYRWDFEQPLITLAQAQQVENSLMAKITSQTQIIGAPSVSGLAPNVGSTASLAGAAVVPAASGPAAASAAGITNSATGLNGFASSGP